MSYCMFCGKELKNGAAFCEYCGSPVQQAANAYGQAAKAYGQAVNAPGQVVYAAHNRITNERGRALEIVRQATVHFSPYQEVFREYYDYLSTKWVRLYRPLMGIIIPAVILVILAIYLIISGIRGAYGMTPAVVVTGCIVAAILATLAVVMQIRHVGKKNKAKSRIIELDEILLTAYEACPVKQYFAPAYALPQIMDQLRVMIESGKANSFEEAINVFNHSIIRIFKGSHDIVLSRALTSRVYKTHSDKIKYPNGQPAIHFVLEQKLY